MATRNFQNFASEIWSHISRHAITRRGMSWNFVRAVFKFNFVFKEGTQAHTGGCRYTGRDRSGGLILRDNAGLDRSYRRVVTVDGE